MLFLLLSINLCVSVAASQNLSILGRKEFILMKKPLVNLLPFSLRAHLPLCRNVLELMHFCIWDFLLDVDSLPVFDHFSLFLLQKSWNFLWSFSSKILI